MMLVMVPSYVHDAINREIGRAIRRLPKCDRRDAVRGKSTIHQYLLGCFDETGLIPEISLTRPTQPTEGKR